MPHKDGEQHKMNTEATAAIERGIIIHAQNHLYEVKSITRDGIITPPIPANISNLSAGDCVYFFVYDDGRGLIIGRY